METNTLGTVEQNTQRTEEIVTGFFGRLAARDPEGMGEYFAEAIDWYVPGDTTLPWIGHRSRRAEVADYFRTMWPHFESDKSTASVEKLIVSGNDAAITIAEGIAGSEPAFADLLNRRATELGMRASRFQNASGLFDPDQVVTARDLATLAGPRA